jgi:hypothetical protein
MMDTLGLKYECYKNEEDEKVWDEPWSTKIKGNQRSIQSEKITKVP